MKRAPVRLCAAALALWPAVLLAQPAAPPPTYGEQVEVNIINVEVYVTGKDGNPVGGLERGDFEVREDGKTVEITNFEAVRAPASAAPSAAPAAPAATTPAAAEAGPDPLHLVVYVDNGFLLPPHRNRVLNQLRDFLGQLGPEDEVMLVTADPGLHVRLPFSRDRAALARTVDEIEKLSALGPSNLAAKRDALNQLYAVRDANKAEPEHEPCLLNIAEPARQYADATRHLVLRSLGAMTALVNSLSGIPGRKALLLVSDGMPVTPGEDVFQVVAEMCGPNGDLGAGQEKAGNERVAPSGAVMRYEPNQAILEAQHYSAVSAFQTFTTHANAQRVTIYSLMAGGLPGAPAASAEFAPGERLQQLSSVSMVETSNLENSMTVLASNTGGRAVLNANDLRQDLARIREDFSTYYSLAYSPPHSGDGREHRIEVRVKRPGLRVRHRQSYRDKPPLERAVDRTLASLFYGYEENPLDVKLETGEAVPAGADTWTVPVRLRIPLFKLGLETRGESLDGKLRVLVAVRSATGESSPLRQVEVPLHIPRGKALIALGQAYQYEVKMTFKKGEQHLAVAVRDEATTATSYLAHTLEIP